PRWCATFAIFWPPVHLCLTSNPPSSMSGAMPSTAEVLLRVAAGSVGDKLALTGRPASATAGVPGSGEALTPEWLSSALCVNTPDAQITGLEITAGSDGTSSRRAIAVTYNQAGTAAGL